MRRVHINGVEWEYEIGRRVVVIYPPDNSKKVIVDFVQLVGKERHDILQDEVESSEHWGGHIPILPSDVKRYIEENVL